jgi:predicted phosphodiesterase
MGINVELVMEEISFGVDMNFQIISDIHGEFYEDRGLGFCMDLPAVAENLILAGDINLVRYLPACLEILADKFEKVIMVPGNHEYYYHYGEDVNDWLREINFSNVHILLNRQIQIGEVKIAGTTMWFKRHPDIAMRKKNLSDFRVIKDYDPWVYEQNRQANEFLRSLEEVDIIVTHHVPTYNLLDMRYKFDDTNLFYVDPILDGYDYNCPAKYWIHGHTHTSANQVCGNTRVIANAAGYNFDSNPNFDSRLILSLGMKLYTIQTIPSACPTPINQV